MRRAFAHKTLKKLGWIGLTLSLSAFTAPQKNDLIELKGFLNGRSEARFRAIDNNKIMILKPGTRGVVKDIRSLSRNPRTGEENFGICVEVHNASDFSPQDRCVWVYYNSSSPAMEIFTQARDEAAQKQMLEAWAKDTKKVTLNPLKKARTPREAKAVETTRPVPAVPEPKVILPTESAPAPTVTNPPVATTPADAEKTGGADAAPVKPNAEDAMEIVRNRIQNVDELNKNANTVLTQNQVVNTPACPDGSCNVQINRGASCNSSNNYQEAALAYLKEASPLASFYNSPQKEIISRYCVQKNLETWGAGTKKSCDANGRATTMRAKACVSPNLIDITAKSFNLAADCFGSIGGSSEAYKQEMALSIYGLMAQESGMHLNVVSHTLAGGPGQLTDDAVIEVNKYLSVFRSELNSAGQRTNNPLCSEILAQAFANPMKPTGVCQRIGIREGNPLKNIAYTFAYQSIAQRALDKAWFQSRIYNGIVAQLPEQEKARLEFALSTWAHNTGPAGMSRPLGFHLRNYVQKGKVLRNAEDVDDFLLDLRLWVGQKPARGNTGRRLSETSKFYWNIQNKVDSMLKTEVRSCLAR